MPFPQHLAPLNCPLSVCAGPWGGRQLGIETLPILRLRLAGAGGEKEDRSISAPQDLGAPHWVLVGSNLVSAMSATSVVWP